MSFHELKPICVELTKSFSVESVEKLRATLKKCKDDELQDMQLYIIFPLQLILKQQLKISEELFCSVTECIRYVVERTMIRIPKLFIDVFTAYTIILGPSQHRSTTQGPSPHYTPTAARNLSEEEKFYSVCLIKTLLNRSDQNVLKAFFCNENLALIGHAISLMIGFAQHEKLKSLRTAAVESLLELTHCKQQGEEWNTSNIAASFLPGIAIGLVQVITTDTKQGISLIQLALHSWSKIVTFILNDELLRMTELELKTSDNNSGGLMNEKLKDLVIVRDEKWARETADKLHVLITRVATFVIGHSQWKIRLAAIEWAKQLLNNSSKILVKSVPKLLEVLVSFIGDEYSSVKRASHDALKNFEAAQDEKTNKLLLEILEENLLVLLTSLPRVIRTAGDDVILSTLQLLTGYLKLLGTRVSSLLQSYSHLERLSIALLQSLELDPSSQIKVLSDTLSTVPTDAINITAQDCYIQLPMKSFKYFTDKNIQKQLLTACRCLGYYGDIDVLLDHFLEQVHASSVYRKQAILVINEIVFGLTGRINDNTLFTEKQITSVDQRVVSAVISEYLSDTLWNSTCSSTYQRNCDQNHWQQEQQQQQQQRCSVDELLAIATIQQTNTTPLILHDSILQTCLLIEGLGNFAKVLGVDFKNSLIDVLYPLMEKLGDDYSLISQTAYNTLLDICNSCRYSSLNDLICQNCDYLANLISLKLRHLSRNPRTPLVLKAMLEHCDVQLLPYIYHIVLDILDCLDDNYGNEGVLFMQVLYSLVLAIKRWFPADDKARNENESVDDPTVREFTAEDLKQFFITRRRDHEIASCRDIDENEDETNDTLNDDEDTATADEEEGKKEAPTHVKIVVQVLERCVHLMSHEIIRIRLLALDTVVIGSQVLHLYQDELLPIVHKLWPPLVERLKDENPQVVLKAFHTLEELGEVCGDFLNQRVRKVALPKVNSFLRSQSVISFKSGQTYKFTVAYKLQLALLTGLGRLCKKLDIRGKACSDVLESCVPYLSAQQPTALQKACVNTVEYLKQLEAQLVWLRLMDIAVVIDLTPPHPQFPFIKFAGSRNRNEFTDNVTKLIRS
ncbi:TELO2-interacting protein 1 homolog [Tubulanus polymorphus]|uniref:TELO2-interacting protein 1 homolog n=1 Tax=Tubulanus polymorphus TaxID=672921 RepID=UPI003DA5D8CF